MAVGDKIALSDQQLIATVCKLHMTPETNPYIKYHKMASIFIEQPLLNVSLRVQESKST